jgi:hypothetical protein
MTVARTFEQAGFGVQIVVDSFEGRGLLGSGCAAIRWPRFMRP